MQNNPLPRLDSNPDLTDRLLPYCRLRRSDVWIDSVRGHRVGCLDATDDQEVKKIMDGDRARLAIHDPPCNLVAFKQKSVSKYLDWCQQWILNSDTALADDSSLYIWLGADQKQDYRPLPDFMIIMRDMPFQPKSLITLRNQRGYGTQKNWMAIRQELLYCIKGSPPFNVNAEYTDIPKILRGYYKEVNGKMTGNLERSRSETIRAGNVRVDMQRIFYLMEENVSGCYVQEPIKCID